ncbi:hypothetical protein NP493_383g01039 [Ridgeia piscesae]|uniref:Inositol oxygenase n=1 Tax=Ridgeia piscesae TaxID=27915 RepID=A0AAD9L296_RIDPI|nr:hypothetical protein NP493_383g01039 [Ridgeia piscesae]
MFFLFSQPVRILDPSVTFRPEKSEEYFRNYTSNNVYHERVRNTYYEMHTRQTLSYAKERLEYWTKFDHGERTIMEALDILNSVVDESDPDVDIPNSVHAYQTAERIREVHPDLDWFHLVGLIHDLGKVMVQFGEPQWSVTGDTFPLGCRFSDHIVFGRESFTDSDDCKDSVYSSELGIYEKNCGLQRVVMSWGHDEYMYRVLRNHATCRLPEEGLYVIRFHSFYPYHTSGDYTYLCDNNDTEQLEWLNRFNKFDLYSKADSMPAVEELRPYYQGLIDKYIPGKLKW